METIIIMSDIGLNILELRILLHILRYKIDAKMFEQRIIMKKFSRKLIKPQVGQYAYVL